MQPDDAIRIRHMIEAAETAQRFVQGRQRADLDADQLLVFGLTRAIEIIGEAGSKFSKQTRNAYPSVPWRNIISMGNRLIHAYHEIDHNILWKTVTQEIPDLLPLLLPIASTE